MNRFDIVEYAHQVAGFGSVRAVEPTPIPDPPMRPDSMDVLLLGNEAIEEVAQSVEDAEASGKLERMRYARP